MRLIALWRLCGWIGHDRERYQAGWYHDRGGRQRERWYSRCRRCGTSDGGTVFEPGILEFNRFRQWRWAARGRLQAWIGRNCEDCGKRRIRFGHEVGQHDNCEEIPF